MYKQVIYIGIGIYLIIISIGFIKLLLLCNKKPKVKPRNEIMKNIIDDFKPVHTESAKSFENIDFRKTSRRLEKDGKLDNHDFFK